MGGKPRNPYPHARKFRKQGNEETRRKSANARNINRPKLLYQYKKSRERVIEEEKSYLWMIEVTKILGVSRECREKLREGRNRKKMNSGEICVIDETVLRARDFERYNVNLEKR